MYGNVSGTNARRRLLGRGIVGRVITAALRIRPSGRVVVDVMVSPDGHRVEQVLVQRSLSRPPKPYLRVRHGTYFVHDCATVEEVALLLDIATLVPEQR